MCRFAPICSKFPVIQYGDRSIFRRHKLAVSFSAEIRRLFTDTDIAHMSYFCDLSNYDHVEARADGILDV
jgi:hypothetical protein